MDNIEQLFIRACNSKDPHKRVHSVYRRFYISHGGCNAYTINIACILSAIVERYGLTDVQKIIDDLAPKAMFGLEPRSYWERVFDVMISKIRLARVAKFKGLIAPLKLRHLEKENEASKR